MHTRIGRADDDAHGVLIESLVSAFSLKIFEMAPDGTIQQKIVVFVYVDLIRTKKFIQTLPLDSPSFAFRKRLNKKREVGERLHGGDAPLGKLIPEERKIESAFQVMHPRFQKTFTVQAHPEADRTRALKRRERRLRKIDLRLGRLQVDVAKHDRARHGLFHHLCSPSCLRARVKSFPPYESEFFEGENHAAEIIPGTTEGMVIVVCPAESEPILPLFLILRSAITAFPV